MPLSLVFRFIYVDFHFSMINFKNSVFYINLPLVYFSAARIIPVCRWIDAHTGMVVLVSLLRVMLRVAVEVD